MSNVSLVNGHIDKPKFTDEQIRKALEYCTNNDDCGTDCPCFSEKQNMCGDYNGLLKQSLDLINCLIAQNGVYETCNARKDESIRQLESEIERLKAEPHPKQGKWLINPDGYYPYCSECGAEPEGRKMTKFCPECGTPMTRR